MAGRDFWHDGSDDILWRNAVTGEAGVWNMRAGSPVWQSFGYLDPAWSRAGSGDINGDGWVDLTWQRALPPGPDAAEVEVLAWGMAAGGILGDRDLFTYTATQTQPSAATGRLFVADRVDVTGDTRADLLELTESAAGTRITIHSMDRRGVVNEIAYDVGNFTFLTAADFTGDGTADILWRGADGETGIWIMRFGIPVGWVGFGKVDSAWGVAGTGDLTGDGVDDIIWQRGERFGFWDIDAGGTEARWTELGTVSGWSLTGIGDYDGDGTDDLLWRNSSTGEIGYWDMEGGAIAGWHSLGTVAAAWTAA